MNINYWIEEYKRSNDIILLDVRTDEEFASGHILDAINIEYDQLPRFINQLDKNKMYYVYCHSGNRSQIAVDFLHKHNFKAVNIGGINQYK